MSTRNWNLGRVGQRLPRNAKQPALFADMENKGEKTLAVKPATLQDGPVKRSNDAIETVSELIPPTDEERRESERLKIRHEIDELMNKPEQNEDRLKSLVRTIRKSKLTDAEVNACLLEAKLDHTYRAKVKALARCSAKLHSQYLKGEIGFNKAYAAAVREGLSAVEIEGANRAKLRLLVTKAARLAEAAKLSESMQVEAGSITIRVEILERKK